MNKANIQEKKITQKLNSMYPDKIIVSLHEKDPKLYTLLLKLSKSNQISIKEYLVRLGFGYDRKNMINNSSNEEM